MAFFGGWSPLHVEIIRFLVLLLFSLDTVFQTALCAFFFQLDLGVPGAILVLLLLLRICRQKRQHRSN